ncbi:MAG: sodium:calcium antiporter [Planctomycetota bacterium]
MFSKYLFGNELPTWALFLELAVAGLIVIMAGRKFTRLADDMADKLNLGSGWVGLILLATVTSLPEVVTGSTATWIGNPDMAIAALFGSCSFNITLIFLLNFITRGGSVLKGVSESHALTSSFGLALIAIALFGVMLGKKFEAPEHENFAQICEICWAVTILIIYVWCMQLTYRYEKRIDEQLADQQGESFGAGNYAKVAGIAVVIVVAAWWLARTGDVLSDHKIGFLGRSLGSTFVGAGFLAFATSLPEITTSVTAVRLGNLNMALGNIFGSNMFNIFVIPMLKAVSLMRGDTLLMHKDSFDATQSVFTGMLAILLTAIALGGLTYKSKRVMLGKWKMGFDSILIGIVYLGGMFLLLSD